MTLFPRNKNGPEILVCSENKCTFDIFQHLKNENLSKLCKIQKLILCSFYSMNFNINCISVNFQIFEVKMPKEDSRHIYFYEFKLDRRETQAGRNINEV